MANIKVTIDYPIANGLPLTFKSPADCSQVTGLVVSYPDGSKTKTKTFQFADAHGNNVGSIDLFASNVLVKVILDVDASKVYVQNADTNKYIEDRFNNLTAADVGALDNTSSGQTIPANSDLNDYITPGIYKSGGSSASATIANAPFTNSGFKMIVTKHYTTTGILQIVLPIAATYPFMYRYYEGGAWYGWRKVYDTGNKPTAEDVGAVSPTKYLPVGTDLNTVTTSGFYRFETAVNAPTGVSYSQLLVMHGGLDTITQIVGDYAGGALWTRSGAPSDVGGDGKWSAWKKLATTDKVMLLDGSNAMTGRLNFQKVNNGSARIHKNHSTEVDYGLALTDEDASGKTALIKLSAQDDKVSFVNNAGKEKTILHTGNRELVVPLYTATVTTNWTASGDYFYQDIAVSGILATDTPIVDIAATANDNDANILYSESMCKVFRVTTSANSIRVWATEAIGTAFPIQIKVVR